MLIADGDTGGFWVGIGGVTVSVLTAAVSAFMVFRKDKREERKDVISEWKETTDNLRRELRDVKDELHEVRNESNTKILDLYGKHKTCEAENALLKAEYDSVKTDNKAMRVEMARMGKQIEDLQHGGVK